mgnify:CR=1 FL=1
MRFMVIVKATADSEAGVMPSEELLAQMGVSPDSWIPPLVSPGFATDLIKTAIQGGLPAAGLPGQAVTQGLVSLLAWTALPFAAAVAWFNRQDLSKE